MRTINQTTGNTTPKEAKQLLFEIWEEFDKEGRKHPENFNRKQFIKDCGMKE